MKKCIAILLGLSSMNALFTQTTPVLSQRIDVKLSLGYTLEQDDNDLSTQANSLGFGAAVDYYAGAGDLKFALSPYVHLMQGEDLAGMKPYYKRRDFTLTEYNSGTYYTAGMLMGCRYTFPVRNASGLPVFHLNAQYGFVAAHIPAVEAVYNTIDLDGVMLRTDEAMALGTALRFAIAADVIQTGNTLYTVNLGVRREAADVPFITNTNEGSPEMDVLKWRGVTASIGLGVAFQLE
jgi:hypothetical protein